MKNEEYKSNQCLLFVLCLVLFLVGCSVKKKGIDRRQEKLEQYGLQKDSIVWTELTAQLRERRIALEHWQLSPPDSSDRQYVQSVTLVQTEEKVHQEEQSDLRRESHLQVETTEEKQMKYKEQSEAGSRRFPVWGAGIVLLIVVLGLWYIFCLR